MNQVILIFSAVVAASRGVAIAGILGQYHSQNEVHDYTYGYHGGPSAKHEIKVNNVTRGSYSYLDPNGVLQTVNYTSDEHGFRVQATNLPTKLGHAIVPENRTRVHPVYPANPHPYLLPPTANPSQYVYYPAPVLPVAHPVPTYPVFTPIARFVPIEAHKRSRRNVYPSYTPVKSLKHSSIALDSTYVPVPYAPVPKAYSHYGYEKPIAKPAGPAEYVEKPSYEHASYSYPRSHIPIEEETYDLPEDKPKFVPASAIPAAKLFVPVPTKSAPTVAPTPAPTTTPPAYQPYHSPTHYASPSPPPYPTTTPAPSSPEPVHQYYYSPSPSHYASPTPTPSPSSPVPAYEPYHSPSHYASPSPSPTPSPITTAAPTTSVPTPVAEVYIRPLVKHFAPVAKYYDHPQYEHVPHPTPAPSTPAPTTLPPTTPPPTTLRPTTPSHVETYYIPHEARAPIPHQIVVKPALPAPVPVAEVKPVHAALPAVIATPIRSQFHSQDELGQYTYGYANEISSKHEIKTADGITQGAYSYVDANGHVQHVNYVSDDHHGFRVAATNLPKGPVPVRHSEVVPIPVVVAEHEK